MAKVLERSLYQTDYYAWTRQQAAELRALAARRVDSKLDLENLAEEVESLGRSDLNTVRSQVRRIIEHLLKLEHSPAPSHASIGATRWLRPATRSKITSRRACSVTLPPTSTSSSDEPGAMLLRGSSSTVSAKQPMRCRKLALTGSSRSSIRAGTRRTGTVWSTRSTSERPDYCVPLSASWSLSAAAFSLATSSGTWPGGISLRYRLSSAAICASDCSR